MNDEALKLLKRSIQSASALLFFFNFFFTILLFHQSFGDARDDFLFLVAEDVERVQVSLEQSVQEEEDLFIFFVLVAEFTQRDGDAFARFFLRAR
jgi:hypothetical protein